jgi:hypothetical protein
MFSLKRSLESKPELLYDWRCTDNQFGLATTLLRFTNINFFPQLNTCGHSPYVTSSLTSDWSVVYNCCWSSPAQSFSGPSSAGIMPTFYFLRFEIRPTWTSRSQYLYPPGTRWPSYTPRYWVPLSSSAVSRRATVEVFDSASTPTDHQLLI